MKGGRADHRHPETGAGTRRERMETQHAHRVRQTAAASYDLRGSSFFGIQMR